MWPLKERDIERFWKKVDRTGGPGACWPWIGGKADGYGSFSLNGRKEGAHRIALALSLGREIQPGMCACHAPVVCHNRACCNADHIREASRSDNAKDMIPDGTHRVPEGFLADVEGKRLARMCPAGHAYSGENLYVDRKGWRHCRECMRFAARKYYRRGREGAQPF